jgi:hypothetical protein
MTASLVDPCGSDFHARYVRNWELSKPPAMERAERNEWCFEIVVQAGTSMVKAAGTRPGSSRFAAGDHSMVIGTLK